MVLKRKHQTEYQQNYPNFLYGYQNTYVVHVLIETEGGKKLRVL